MKKIAIAFILFSSGAILTLISLSSDFFRGKPFLLGWAQISLLLVGVSFIYFGFLAKNNKLISLLVIILRKAKQAFLFVVSGINKEGKKIDFAISTVFLIYALLFFLGRWGGLEPVLLVDKNGDAGALLSYAAAGDVPLNFSGDQILNPSKQMTSYNGIYLPYIRFVNSLVGDYGLAFLTLLPFCIFVQLFSFYLLGMEIFHNRFWAVLLSAVSAVNISYGFWDWWGFAFDPLPRFLFQAIMPFLLLLFLKWKHQPQKWFWLMMISSALFFIHVISTPCIACMLWIGFFLYIPDSWRFQKKMLFQIFNGLVFAIPFTIFVILSKTNSGITTITAGASYSEIMNYLTANFGALLNLKDSFLLFIRVLYPINIIIPTIIGILVIYAYKTHRELSTNLIITWLCACLLISLVFPAIEHAIEKSIGVPPVQLDLVRNLRYAIPLLLILVVSGFASLQKTITSKYREKLSGIVLSLMISIAGCIWFYSVMIKDYIRNQTYGFNFVTQEVKCIASGDLFCPTMKQTAEAGVLTFIKNGTPVESRFLSMPDDALANEIRYAGFRSVAFTTIDKNRIAYYDLEKAVEINRITKEWTSNLKDHPDNFSFWAEELGCKIGVTHWLVDTDYRINLQDHLTDDRIIFKNNTYSVIELPVCK